MLNIRNRSIATKIGFIIAGFAALVCLLVGLAAYSFKDTDAIVQGALGDQAKSLFVVADAHEKKTRMHQRAFEVVVESDSAQWAKLQGAFVEEADQLQSVLDAVKPMMDANDLRFFEPILQDLQRYRTLEDRVYDLKKSGKSTDAEDLLQGEMNRIFVDFDKNFDGLFAKQKNDLDDAGAQIHALSQKTILFMILAGIVGLVLAIAGALLLVASQISRPLKAMTDAMGRLASGDTSILVPASDRTDEIGAMSTAVQTFKEAAIAKLRLEGEAQEARRLAEAERSRNEAERAKAAEQQSMVVTGIATGLERLADGDLVFRLQTPFSAEYEKLRTDFNGAVDKLQQTMTVVAGNTTAIRSGSSEISTAADDLSKRTEQQAASLEETAAALDEITATVKKTSEGAQHARQVVSTAKADAEHSGGVVGHAVEAMTAIETSSRQVSQIIGVIDEIAFQTNLLALNAGVEAARAGDAGRGFAVVASEVRALAQRSAEAAKEIKALISKSSEQVSEGVNLVGETGKSLKRIVAQVAEINAIVSDIASSAQEQATGLDQVNTAVNQMDQVTQQNAAMVEQSTAASHSLAQEAEELARLVGQFRTGSVGGVSRRATAPAAVPRGTALRGAGRAAAARRLEPEADQGWEEF